MAEHTELFILARKQSDGFERVPVVDLSALERAVADLQAVYPSIDSTIEPGPNGNGDTTTVLERVIALETAVAEIRDSLPPVFLRER